MTRSRTRPVVALLAAALLATAACTAPDRDGTGATATPSGTGAPDRAATSTPTPSAAVEPSTAELRTAADDVVPGLGVVAGEGLTRGPDDVDAEGMRTLTWTTRGGPVADVAVAAAVHLVAADGWTLDLHDDGSVVARDADGVARVGVAPPTGVAADGAPDPLVVHELRTEDVLTLTLNAGGVADDATIGDVDLTLRVGTAALVSADWGDREGGRSLAVVPTAWARGGHEAALELLRAQLHAAEPETTSAVMDDQLVCHSVGAPDKESWNLEPWRPDVGLLGVLAAACNPT
ncbi:DUF2599 domain-containing protein [Cellulomonas sp. APG4]|uniref:DUF2599 domain-containing protein n=1 Tax=Cellulomonas sp. APG4 TaxID=1538656 RepID=UPI00137ADC57|nr:DUF2599 domain-containing protein [Cellulomonas sp. APG4]NCT90298.1 DUF2599 domain-containing protein [Cellulomonas sp. APG4]